MPIWFKNMVWQNRVQDTKLAPIVNYKKRICCIHVCNFKNYSLFYLGVELNRPLSAPTSASGAGTNKPIIPSQIRSSLAERLVRMRVRNENRFAARYVSNRRIFHDPIPCEANQCIWCTTVVDKSAHVGKNGN